MFLYVNLYNYINVYFLIYERIHINDAVVALVVIKWYVK
jgi:hypothetical protein